MCKGKFSNEIKRDAVAQITERDYPVAEVSQRLGVSAHSLHAWRRKFAKACSGETENDAEIRLLKRALTRLVDAEPPDKGRCIAGAAHGRLASQAED